MPNLTGPLGVALNATAKGDILTWYLQYGHFQLDSLNINEAGNLTVTKLLNAPPTEIRPSTPPAEREEEEAAFNVARALDGEASGSSVSYPAPFGSCLSIATTSSTKMTYAFALRDSDGAVCMVSPVYYPLVTAKNKGNGIAACTVVENGPEKTWVYFIGEDEKTNRRFYKFEVSDLTTITRVRNYEPSVVSQLSVALMNPDGGPLSPYLFYQSDEDGDVGIMYAAVNKTHSEQILQVGELSAGTTPLATCNFRGSVFLFYLSATQVIKAIKHGKNGWENSFALMDDGRPIKADISSGLGATADEAQDRIVVVYNLPVGTVNRKRPCNVHVLASPLSVQAQS